MAARRRSFLGGRSATASARLGCCLIALAAAGCANWQVPRLDPTGEHIFLPPNSPVPALPPGSPAAVAPPLGPGQGGVSVSPSQIAAPVGSEVLLIASVVGGEGYLLTNEPVEWTIGAGSVGYFVSPGERRALDVVNWWRGLPVVLAPNYVANSTLFRPMTLERGTPTPLDDIVIHSGQSWVTVSSPIEGTSSVSALVPGINDWDKRQQTAFIYWLDAQWQFPPPAITPAGGRNTLVTTLTRQTNGMPLAGWTVRYEVASGPAAGFAPGGAASVEVVTNEAGQASAEISQSAPAAGTNQVNIHILRPSRPGEQPSNLPVGSGSMLQTWTGGAAGSTTIEPSPIPGPVATPPGTFTPAPSAPQPAPLQPAPPAAQPTPPPAQPTASARPELEVTVRGPTSATVGDHVQFQIRVTNRGNAKATRIVVKDRFDVGIEHAALTSPIERDLVDLEPGISAELAISFRIAQPGQLCQDIEVTAEGDVRATTRHCVEAIASPIQTAPGEQQWQPEPPADGQTPSAVPAVPAEPAAPIPPAEPLGQQPQSATGVTLSLRKQGPEQRRAGETVLFTIELANRGSQPLEDVVIADNFETTLAPARATEGNDWLEGGALGWKVGTLAPGQTTRHDIEFNCLRETPRACNRVTVTARGIQPLADEACVQIVAADGSSAAPMSPPSQPPAAATGGPRQPLKVSVAETTDPVEAGGTTTYQILVENPDAQSYFDVTVGATLSEELHLDKVSGPVTSQGTPQANSLRLVPIRELRAAEAALSFELHVTAVRAGTGRVHVEVTSRGQTRPIVAEQTTQVLP